MQVRAILRRTTRARNARQNDASKATPARLCREAARWTQDHPAELAAAKPNMGRLINREAGCWRALYAIADLAGGEWPDRARKAQAALSTEDQDTDSLGEQLLADIREAWGDWVAEHPQATDHEMTSAELVRRLVEKVAERSLVLANEPRRISRCVGIHSFSAMPAFVVSGALAPRRN